MTQQITELNRKHIYAFQSVANNTENKNVAFLENKRQSKDFLKKKYIILLRQTAREQNEQCRLTASEDVCRQADLIRGMREFFIDG